MAGHGDEELALVKQEVPRTVKAGLESWTAALAATTVLLAGAGHRLDALVLEVDGPQAVVAAVGDIEHVAVQRHALRVVELGLVEAAVLEALDSVAGDGDLFA